MVAALVGVALGVRANIRLETPAPQPSLHLSVNPEALPTALVGVALGVRAGEGQHEEAVRRL